MVLKRFRRYAAKFYCGGFSTKVWQLRCRICECNNEKFQDLIVENKQDFEIPKHVRDDMFGVFNLLEQVQDQVFKRGSRIAFVGTYCSR